MTWPLPHWQAAVVALVLGLLAYFAICNQALRHERDKLQTVNSQLTGQLDWQNSTQRVVAAIDEHRTKELNDAKNQIAELQFAVASGARKLQLAATCPASSTPGMVDATGPRLTDAAERDYFRLRERIETARSQIAGLQDYIRNVCLAK
ncbi:Bacteriophage lysis protein [Serratia quinivorans]|uniref:lysis protein n=1 Tax=Serratia quinivorans TaxID=137545 RepID=UPI00217B78BE|nr:lysis protein [Serratia quinivorans]CAI0814270.1 Bacteriophage lysis protein [Serratia quinivorans]CAI0923931.1 Bacteriophage lysis protein [Serratia quinivorans]CAI1713138.1 Bacteriophage lysis protein [Serratia quinivorans]CAI2089238.1 Bacteriophage lysis protein [Serratia quinivorans]CAI2429837.1 Bacteriophage lysis protein [Serratia quinivorans]